jgi:hypothetical protein
MCGQGSHPACTGTGLHHFDDPGADNGIPFICACGCHYVPAYRGTVYVVAPEVEPEEEVIPARELEEVEPEEAQSEEVSA